jgi:Domain of Unknown function (DUF542)
VNTTDVATPLGAIASERPDAIALFERLGLDDSSGGSRTLEQACAQRGLDAVTVGVVNASRPPSDLTLQRSQTCATPGPSHWVDEEHLPVHMLTHPQISRRRGGRVSTA